jgi:hypothetical protein
LKINKLKTLAILMLIIIIVIAFLIFIVEFVESKNTSCAYLATLTDEKNVILYDEDGNKITIFEGNDGYKNQVILLEKPTQKNKLYQVVVLEKTGELVSGYINGKYFNKKITKIKNYDITEGLGEISTVNTSKGVYVRTNKIVDKNSDTAKLLSSGTYVLAGVTETSLHNSYAWKRVLYFDSDNNIQSGYIVSDYLLAVEKVVSENDEFKIEYTSFSKIEALVVDENDTMIIKQVDTDSENSVDLKLVETPGKDSKVIAKLENGTKLYTTQKYIDECNLSQKIDGYKWLQVIMEDGEEGYVIEDYLNNVKSKEPQDFIEEYKKMYEEGNISGFTGIDVAPRYLGSVGDFEKILNGTGSLPKRN